MRYLLDTHVLLWLFGEPARVPVDVRRVLADRTNDVLVSAVSALEIATKVRLDRLAGARPLVDAWDERLRDIGTAELSISTAHALLAGSMTWAHRDPFDRLLVAQAVVENLALVTTNAAIIPVPGVRIVSW